MIYFLFFPASIIESSVFIIFTMCLFQFGRLSSYRKEIAITATILTTVSFIFTYFKIQEYSVFAQVILLVLFFSKLFNEKLLYSIVVTVSGYVSYIIIQLALIKIETFYNLFSMSDVGAGFNSLAYINQLFSAIVFAAISLAIRKSEAGYGFTLMKRYPKYHLLFVVLSILTTIGVLLLFCSFYSDKHSSIVYVYCGILFVAQILLSIFSIKQQKLEFGS